MYILRKKRLLLVTNCLFQRRNKIITQDLQKSKNCKHTVSKGIFKKLITFHSIFVQILQLFSKTGVRKWYSKSTFLYNIAAFEYIRGETNINQIRMFLKVSVAVRYWTFENYFKVFLVMNITFFSRRESLRQGKPVRKVSIFGDF